MKKWIYLPAIACIMLTNSCKTGQPALTGGIDKKNMDISAAPGADFYRYACGGWMDAHPLTDEYARFGSFDQLAENNRLQINGLIEEIAAKQHEAGSVAQKIGDLYTMAMDSVLLNTQGGEPLKRELEKISAVTSKEEMPVLLAQMRRSGFDTYFVAYVSADAKNSDWNIVSTRQSGISLDEKEYYLDEDEHTLNIRTKYQEHVAKMFELAGKESNEALKAAADVMQIETQLATNFKSALELRNPLANYNKVSMEELKKEIPGFDWDAYFNAYGLEGLKELNVGQWQALKASVDIINNTPLEMQKSYLAWKVIDAAASYLSDPFVQQNFDFYEKTLSGKKEMQPRWKRAVSTVNGALGEAVGQLYVEKYFPAAAKERMTELIGNLQKALGERITSLEWMSEETKQKALEKLSTFHVKVGYPDKWRDYSSLEIKKDSYWENILRATHFSYDYMLAKAGKPVDKEEWLMKPQTVNAYYNPTTNEICFPAGILQYPFFDMHADDAFNYGAIGVVIGHEMTHGFDDQGRLFDKDGNLKEWWTAEDAVNFEARAQVLVDYFDAIEVLPGLNANGKFTLGENIADHGGLQIAYTALQNVMQSKPLNEVDGFTPEQRFFIAYANLWAGNVREEQIRLLTKSDVHSLGRWRVNGALPHISMWYKAFGIQENDPMYIPEEKRVSIW